MNESPMLHRTSPWALLVALSACPSKPTPMQRADIAPDAGVAEAVDAAEIPRQAAPTSTGAAKARPSTSSIWAGESGGLHVEWTPQGIAVRQPGGKSVDLFERSKGEQGCEGEQTDRLLSVVGSIVSYEEFVGTTCEGAAHPSAITFYAAVDAAHPGQKLRLTDLFADADVLRALLADAVVKRHVPKPAPKTTAALVKALEGSDPECEYSFGPDLLNRFAFHHVEGNQVAVRIGLSHGCEVARGKLTQLGILLPIPPTLREPLERASTRAEGFLMRDQAAVSAGKETRLHF
jgi:hypothetical protein